MKETNMKAFSPDAIKATTDSIPDAPTKEEQPVAVAPTKEEQPVTIAPSGGGLLAAYNEKKANDLPPDQSSVNWVNFFNTKIQNASLAQALRSALPESKTNGDTYSPYVNRGGVILDATEARFVMLESFAFFAATDSIGQPVRLVNPGEGDEFVEALILVWLNGELIPATLRLRTAQCSFAKQLAAAQTESTKPEWAKAPGRDHKLRAEMQANLGPIFRVTASMAITIKKSKKGYNYSVVNAVLHDPTSDIVTALQSAPADWPELAAVKASYDARVDMLKRLPSN